MSEITGNNKFTVRVLSDEERRKVKELEAEITASVERERAARNALIEYTNEIAGAGFNWQWDVDRTCFLLSSVRFERG